MKTEFIYRGSAEDSINKVSNHVFITYTGMSFKCGAFFMHHIELYPEEEIAGSVGDVTLFFLPVLRKSRIPILNEKVCTLHSSSH